jgi:metal-responsive CopG/Arc/MetJ family transcriptional regulator
MARINLTLDRDTYAELEEHVARAKKPRARVVKELLVEALSRHKARARRERLAHDYAAEREDARKTLGDLESGQLELLGDEDA